MFSGISKNGVYVLAAALCAAAACIVFAFVFSNILRQLFIFSSAFMLCISAAAYFFNIEPVKAGEENSKPEVKIN